MTTETIDDKVRRLLSDEIIREIAERHFDGMKFNCPVLAEECRRAATTLLQFHSDAKVRREIETLYRRCTSALTAKSIDAKAESVARHFDAMSETAKKQWLGRRPQSSKCLEELCLRSGSAQDKRASIEKLRSLTILGGEMTLGRKRSGRSAERERSIKFVPIFNAPTTKRGQQAPEGNRDFLMWMRIAYLDASGEPPNVKADNRTPGRFIPFATEILERLGVKSVDLVRATNYLASLRSEIRDETPADREAVRSVNEAAFGRPDEADLVDNLRNDGDVMLSLVAVEGGRIVGHILFSRMDAPFRAWGLGPVAVSPDHQRAGIGSNLIQAGLDRVRKSGVDGVFVLGAPSYYKRFGFDPALASGFTSPYAGPYLMALGVNGTLPATTGSVEYAPAFARLG